MTERVSIPKQEKVKLGDKPVLVLSAVVFFVLLLLRDSFSVGINKSIFIALTVACAALMKIETLVCLFCFLFPLYFGLPGNYMTLILMARMLISFNKLKFKASSFFLTFLIAVFVFLQNLITGYTGIVPMMFVVGTIAVLMMFSYSKQYDINMMILMFSAGVAALGFIMLKSTLNVYELSDLLSVGFRLGSSGVDYAEEGVMNVNVDPNYYGMFTVCAFSIAAPQFLDRGISFLHKIFISFFLAVALLVSLVGLSRAFIIVFAIWILLFTFAQKNIKRALLIALVFVVVAIVIVTKMDNVWSVIYDRFQASDMADGNGRIRLIVKFFNLWFETIASLFFGVGLYNCNVHCMPLQFLFGGGIMLFALMCLLCWSYVPKKKSLSFSGLLPFFITLLMMSTIPVATLLNFMFPLIFVGLVSNNRQEK